MKRLVMIAVGGVIVSVFAITGPPAFTGDAAASLDYVAGLNDARNTGKRLIAGAETRSQDGHVSNSAPNVSTKKVSAKVGREFTIDLESNPTTGYRWQLAAPLDQLKVVNVSNKFRAPKTDRIGAGGEEQWVFRVVGEGTTVILLKYVRPFDPDGPAERLFRCTVVGTR